MLFQSQADETGSGQDDRIVLAVKRLAHTRVHSAAQRGSMEIRSPGEKLGGAAQAGCPDCCAFGERGEGVSVFGNQYIPYIGTSGDASNRQSGWIFHGQILQGMDRTMNRARQQLHFQLLREEALPANFR